MNLRRYQLPWSFHGGSSADLIFLERDANASCRPPAASSAERSVKKRKINEMFSKQISIKNSKLFAVNNFRQVLRSLEPWKILTFFCQWTITLEFSGKTNLFVDLMKSNLIKVYLSYERHCGTAGERESKADISCRNAGEKSGGEILLYGLFFVLKPIRENLLKRLGSNLYGNSISRKTIFR